VEESAMKKIWAAGVAVVVLAGIAPALAHHSPAAFDRTKTVTIEGTVKEFRWQNPHSWILLEVKDEQGEMVVWSVEMTSPTFLVRAGWRSNSVKPGDTVSVTVNPVRTGEPSGMFVSLRMDDGTTLTERPARLGP
jgi:hypothetical protein